MIENRLPDPCPRGDGLQPELGLEGVGVGDQKQRSFRIKLAEAILKFQLSRKEMEKGLGVLLFPFCALELYSVANFCVSEIPLFRVSWC